MPENRLKNDTPPTKPPLWTRDFVLITVSNLLVFMAFQSLPSALPLYLNELGISTGMIGLAVGATTITAIVTRPFAGAGVDIIGRKVFFIAGMVALILTIGPIGLVPTIGFVILMRALLGFAWGVTNTAATTAAGDIIPRQRFGEGMGYFSLSSAIALAIAPAMAITLVATMPFELVAIIASVLVVLALLLSLFIKYKPVVRGPVPDPAPDSVPNPAKSQNTKAADRPRLSAKQMTAEMFDKSAVVPGIIMMCSNMVYGSMTTFIALLGAERGLDSIPLMLPVSNTALFFVVYAVAVIFSRPFFGKLVDRRGYTIPVTVGLLSMSLGLVFVVLAQDVWLFLLAAVVFGVGQGCVVSSLQTMAVADAPFERRGAATSTFFIFFDGGIGIGAMISGGIATAVGITGMFTGYIALPLIGLLIHILFARHRKNPTAIR